ncbi:MAG: anhydro-N-acetylmuramic acid kinase [Pseudomonadota bacterium]
MSRLTDQHVVLRALGLMSGTSLDGVDAAVIETDGQQIFDFGPSEYQPYMPDERAILSEALGQWSGAQVRAAQAVIEQVHQELIGRFEPCDLIGFHGQTLAHAPGDQGTLQVGDGAALANSVGTPVVWDFRSEDVAKGGEGAPLACFYHFACAHWMGANEPLAFLNLGGVGNITWIDPTAQAPEDPGALLAFDTGPANAPINDAMQARFGMPFDRDGAIAAKGVVNDDVVADFLTSRYFEQKPPKSLDRNAFAQAAGRVRHLSDADAIATLTEFVAVSVARGMSHCPTPPRQVLVTGGGRHNSVLMARLSVHLDCTVRPIEDAGLDGDMLEAQAFAYLAVRVTRNLPTSCPGTTGVPSPVGGGTLSTP